MAFATEKPLSDTASKAGLAAPIGLNHLVLNVRNLEESHRFWTEVVGFRQVGELKATPQRPNPARMRFYSGDHGGGRMSHHDFAMIENPDLPPPPSEWSMSGQPTAISHIAIAYPTVKAGCAASTRAALRREVQPPHRTWHDAQPVYQRPERLWG
jgi:catechol 2,3-dioxygenase